MSLFATTKKFTSALAVSFLLATSAFGGVGKVAELLYSQASLIKFFDESTTLSSDVAIKRAGQVEQAIKAIVGKKKARDPKALVKKLNSIAVTKEKDVEYINKIREAIKVIEMEDASAEQLKRLTDDLMIIANRHNFGPNVISSCSTCLSEEEAAAGFEVTLQALKALEVRQASQKIRHAISSPVKLKKYLNRTLSKYKVNLGQVPAGYFKEGEQKELAIALQVMDNPGAKAPLVKAYKELITRNGDVKVIDPDNLNKFWKVLIEDMSEDEIKQWTVMFEAIAKDSKDSINKKDAFYKYLYKLAENNESLTRDVRKMELEKSCFFPKI